MKDNCPSGKQVQILYSTRCCESQLFSKNDVTVVRWEDVLKETSQKTDRITCC